MRDLNKKFDENLKHNLWNRLGDSLEHSLDKTAQSTQNVEEMNDE
jgi:hypothetical protein